MSALDRGYAVTAGELAARLSARGVRTTAGQADVLLRDFAARGVVVVNEGRWQLTERGHEVARGLRQFEEEGS